VTSRSTLANEKRQKQFSKILVAINGSDHSMKAAGYAIDIARDNKAQLIALAVLDITQVGYAASAFIASPMHGLDELEQKRREAQEWLDKIAKLIVSQKANDDIQFKSKGSNVSSRYYSRVCRESKYRFNCSWQQRKIRS
jgi:nucleotide-binding universal stress UspA family protein